MKVKPWIAPTIGAAVLVLVLAAIALTGAPDLEAADVTVYATPTCGCCREWAKHMQKAGFTVRIETLRNLTPIKTQHEVPHALRTCHTAIVDGYVVEGHVPADVIQRLLDERPNATGIAVPGMPIGSPGMEQGDVREPYTVVLFNREGRTETYARR